MKYRECNTHLLMGKPVVVGWLDPLEPRSVMASTVKPTNSHSDSLVFVTSICVPLVTHRPANSEDEVLVILRM